MERLTQQKFNMCDNCSEGTICEHYCNPSFPVCGNKAIYDRLAAYEDTGLEPEEIVLRILAAEKVKGERDGLLFENKALKADLDGYKDDIQCGDIGALIQKATEYEKAKAEGRLVVLPCKEFYEKIGDFLYLIDGGEITEVLHGGAEIDVNGKPTIIVVAEDDIFPWREPIAEFDTDPADWCVNTKVVTSDDFGKTVFLTREEAEVAMKEDGAK